MTWPNEELVIAACNKTQRETNTGMDGIAKDGAKQAILRANLGEEWSSISCVKLAGQGVSLRKAGKLEKLGSGSGQRSESDLEMEGHSQLNGKRFECAETKRWTETDQYKKTVRAIVLERDSHRCQFCYSTKRLNVHHRSYKRCRTRWEVDDCITLCRTCHGYLHDSWNKRKTGKPSPLQLELNELKDI